MNQGIYEELVTKLVAQKIVDDLPKDMAIQIKAASKL